MLWNYCWLFSQTHIRTETKWHKIRLGKCLYVPNQKSDPGGFIPHSTFLSLTSEMLWETDWHTSASSLVQRITSRRSVSGLYKILGQEPLSNLCNFFLKAFSLEMNSAIPRTQKNSNYWDPCFSWSGAIQQQHQHQAGMCWLPTCKTSLIKKCRIIARTGDGVKKNKKNTDDRNMSRELGSEKVCFSGSPFGLLRDFSVLFKQTPTPLRLIKSSALNVFAERKEIFRAENTFADNSWPRYFPKDGCTRSSAHCVCVCWLRCGQIYFQVIFSPRSSFFSVLWGFWLLLCVRACACDECVRVCCFELTNTNPGHVGN